MVRTPLGSLCALLVLVPAAQASWSAPALLNGCPPAPVGRGASTDALAPVAAAPLIVYPSSEPQVRSGPGALLWNAAGRCAGGVQGAFAAPLGAGGLPGRGEPARGLAAVSAAVGTTAGQVLALGSTAGGEGAFVEGGLAAAFGAVRPLAGPAEPVAAVSGYLGDAVLVSLQKAPPRARGALTKPSRAHARAAGSATEVPAPASWALAVRVQRHYSSAPQPPRVLPLRGAPPDALAVAMDFRSDLLLVWAAQGAIYARELSQGGAPGPARRLASVEGVPELRALFSDDGRAIVAWREQRGPSTRILLGISDAALRFAAPRVVERFADLPGLVPPPGSLRLVRLSSEAVMMAWTGMRAGRYVVRASPVSLRRGAWAPVVVSAPPASSSGSAASAATSSRGAAHPTLAAPPTLPGPPIHPAHLTHPAHPIHPAHPTQALLADLVPGPRAEVLALWTAVPLRAGRLDAHRHVIEAAWGHYGGHGEARFAPPEALSAAGPNGPPAAAFDPQSDRALAAWAIETSSPRIMYSQRSAGPPARAAAARSYWAARLYEGGRPYPTGRPYRSVRSYQSGRPYRTTSPTHAAGSSHAAGRGARPVWLSALALLLLAVAGAVRALSARRRGIRRPRGPARWEGRVRVPHDRTRSWPHRSWRHWSGRH